MVSHLLRNAVDGVPEPSSGDTYIQLPLVNECQIAKRPIVVYLIAAYLNAMLTVKRRAAINEIRVIVLLPRGLVFIVILYRMNNLLEKIHNDDLLKKQNILESKY